MLVFRRDKLGLADFLGECDAQPASAHLGTPGKDLMQTPVQELSPIIGAVSAETAARTGVRYYKMGRFRKHAFSEPVIGIELNEFDNPHDLPGFRPI